MSKNDFLNKIKLLITNSNSRFNQFLLIFIDLFSQFRSDFVFNIEGVKDSISFEIDNHSQFLFIDLTAETLNIRFNYNEFFFFIKEIEEIKFLMDSYFKGDYKTFSYNNGKEITKILLKWNDKKNEKFNKEDVYTNFTNNGTNIKEDIGFNWYLHFQSGSRAEDPDWT